MTVFLVDSYVIKPDKLSEFTAFLKKYTERLKKRPDLTKEVKSHKIFSLMLGGKGCEYVEMWEFENLAEFEKFFNRIMQDKEFTTTLNLESARLIVPASESIEIWSSVP
ncbi:MAG: hypothetical protein FJZ49_04675 [Candidatus Verstraetearchaeota archaeon]|nr:hypothetical protein [Candidatus Verstraetearchaeota archaeon]